MSENKVKLCINCGFYKTEGFGSNLIHCCVQGCEQIEDVVTGEINYNNTKCCYVERQSLDKNCCGPEGKHYVIKYIKKPRIIK